MKKTIFTITMIFLPLVGYAEADWRLPIRGDGKVGITSLEYHDAQRNRTLAVKLWYPATDSAEEKRQNYARMYPGQAADDAAFSEAASPAPLAVLSHGNRGKNVDLAWLAETLTSHGYIVASVNHWLNTTDHYEPEETVRVWHRPKDVSYVLDQLLSDPTWQLRIDKDRIVAVGHSSGGYTVLALAGAIYNPQKMGDYCTASEGGSACKLPEEVDVRRIDYTGASDSYHDHRIKGVVALAPAMGPAIESASLQDMDLPVYLITTENDELLQPEYNAIRYHRFIPNSTIDELPEGGHFVFLSQCNRIAKLMTKFIDFDVCGSQSRTDRGKIHEIVGAKILSFLSDTLPTNQNISLTKKQ